MAALAADSPYSGLSSGYADPTGYVAAPNLYVSSYAPDSYITDPSPYEHPEPAYSNGYEEPPMYGALVPYQPPEPVALPVKRSDTVGRLLDKYCNFSTEREFGYHRPTGAYNRYSEKPRGRHAAEISSYEEVDSNLDDGYNTHLPNPKPSRKNSRDRQNLDLDVNPTGRFSNIYEEDEELAVSPPTKLRNSKPPRYLSPESSVDIDRQSRLRSVDPRESGHPSIYKGSKTSRYLSSERPEQARSDEFKTDVLADPFKPNAGYFDLGRFDDPIADRYARNVTSYNLPDDLDEKYGQAKYGIHNQISDDPVSYGMQGASDYFTPNYNKKFSRYSVEETNYPREQSVDKYGGGGADYDTRRESLPPSRYVDDLEEQKPSSVGTKRNSIAAKDDDKSDLSKRINQFLQPKERESRSKKSASVSSKFSKPKYSEESSLDSYDKPRYGRLNLDSEESSVSSYRKPQKSYGSSGGRRMTSPGMMSSYDDDIQDSGFRYGGDGDNRHTANTSRQSSLRDFRPSYDPDDDNEQYAPSRRYGGGKLSDPGYGGMRRETLSPSSGLDDYPSPLSRKSSVPSSRYGVGGGGEGGRYGFDARGGEGGDIYGGGEGGRYTNDTGSGGGGGGDIYGGGGGRYGRSESRNPYSELVGEEDRPWRRHTSTTRRRPFVSSILDDGDDEYGNSDVGAYNPKHTERQLASQIARQYLGGRNDD